MRSTPCLSAADAALILVASADPDLGSSQVTTGSFWVFSGAAPEWPGSLGRIDESVGVEGEAGHDLPSRISTEMQRAMQVFRSGTSSPMSFASPCHSSASTPTAPGAEPRGHRKRRRLPKRSPLGPRLAFERPPAPGSRLPHPAPQRLPRSPSPEPRTPGRRLCRASDAALRTESRGLGTWRRHAPEVKHGPAPPGRAPSSPHELATVWPMHSMPSSPFAAMLTGSRMSVAAFEPNSCDANTGSN